MATTDKRPKEILEKAAKLTAEIAAVLPLPGKVSFSSDLSELKITFQKPIRMERTVKKNIALTKADQGFEFLRTELNRRGGGREIGENDTIGIRTQATYTTPAELQKALDALGALLKQYGYEHESPNYEATKWPLRGDYNQDGLLHVQEELKVA